MSLVTLLTDFGDKDGYSAAMKGVMLSINPNLTFIDITHNITQGNISAASFIIKSAFKYFPPKTIHVIVVDPGVGSDRKILCVDTGDYFFIAPDNGVLQWIFVEYPDALLYNLENTEFFLSNISNTFHGRDIFAPVAAHLSTGIDITTIGTPTSDYNKGTISQCHELGDIVTGEIVHIDHFGNLVTNIPKRIFYNRQIHSIHIGDQKIKKLCSAYSDVLQGFPVALVGSHGMLEIAIRNGNAGECLNMHIKSKVIVQFQE